MIDLDDFKSNEGEALKAFMAAVYRGLVAERRLSTLVRVTLAGDRHDFRITYVGPSRPRKLARRPSMTQQAIQEESKR